MVHQTSRAYEGFKITEESVTIYVSKTALDFLVADFASLHAESSDKLCYFDKNRKLYFFLSELNAMELHEYSALIGIERDTLNSVIVFFETLLAGEISPVKDRDYYFSDATDSKLERDFMIILDDDLFSHELSPLSGEILEFHRKWLQGKS